MPKCLAGAEVLKCRQPEVVKAVQAPAFGCVRGKIRAFSTTASPGWIDVSFKPPKNEIRGEAKGEPPAVVYPRATTLRVGMRAVSVCPGDAAGWGRLAAPQQHVGKAEPWCSRAATLRRVRLGVPKEFAAAS